jgi:hypothetical protein
MPRASEPEEQREDDRQPSPSARTAARLPKRLRTALRPGIHLEDVDAEDLCLGLEMILPPLLKPPQGKTPTGSKGDDAPARVGDLTREPVEWTRERAPLNYRAARHSGDNRGLTRRAESLEATSRVRALPRGELGPPEDLETGRVTERYVPRQQPGGR